MPAIPYTFGYEPDPHDARDYVLSSRLGTGLASAGLADVDLRPFCSPIHDQGPTNSCVAQAVVSAFELQRIRKYGRAAHIDLSRLQLYFYMREMRGGNMEYQNVGGHIRHAIYVMNKLGIAPESAFTWTPHAYATRPPLSVLMRGHEHKTGAYYRIASTGKDRVEECIKALNLGYGIAFGTDVDEQWFNYRGTAAQSMVLTTASERLGGHATLLVGYIDGNFIGQNSWGTSWGLGGFYRMHPDNIASSRSSDFWVVTGPWETT